MRASRHECAAPHGADGAAANPSATQKYYCDRKVSAHQGATTLEVDNVVAYDGQDTSPAECPALTAQSKAGIIFGGVLVAISLISIIVLISAQCGGPKRGAEATLDDV